MHNDKQYPRPDFQRSNLKWRSLNGEWDFLFDDADVGLLERWYRDGLPNITETALAAEGKNQSLVDTLTQKITGSQRLLKDNEFGRSTGISRKQKITVPFVFQTLASGINNQDAHEVLWYEREIQDLRSIRDIERGDRLLVRFGAVDYEATIWINGRSVCEHQGGHVPFDVDITNAVNERISRLTLRVRDSTYDLTQPRGKQYWAAQPESIFYTPSSGIWQNVWLEVVPAMRIADSSYGTILRSDNIDSGKLHTLIAVLGRRSKQKCSISLACSFLGISVAETQKLDLPRDRDIVPVDLDTKLSREHYDQLNEASRSRLSWDDPVTFHDGVALWSPAHPSLYIVDVRLWDADGNLVDSVITQIGMRSLSWTSGDSTILLNHRPLFQRLCLDQGYWPGTGITPPTSTSCKEDIELAQSMGFNGCRKHQKLEDPWFLYYADQLGYLVWSEMASAYEFSAEYCSRFSSEWEAAVKRDINHPCIITWTPANESWAYTDLQNSVHQRNHLRSLYYQTKVLDPSRPINDNCGWEHVCTDLTTFHDYADASQLKTTCASLEGVLDDKAGHAMFLQAIESEDIGSTHTSGAPVICTEFGGVNIKPTSGQSDNEWGYTTASNSEDLLRRIEALTKAVIGEGTPTEGLISGFVWTQFTDIEQEANGLFTFDRKPKISPERVRIIFEAAEKSYHHGLTRRLRNTPNNDDNR